MACTFFRPSRRRRNPSLARRNSPNVLPEAQQNTSPALDNSRAYDPTTLKHDRLGRPSGIDRSIDSNGLDLAWRNYALASKAVIDHYMDFYMNLVYPMLPLFHRPTLYEDLEKLRYLQDAGLFASIMAACALAAVRGWHGALSDRWRLEDDPERSAEAFFAAAKDTIPNDLERAAGLGFLRACGLLALTSLQQGAITTAQQYLGLYHTLGRMQKTYDERSWPPSMPIIEQEERRRLFWTVYKLEINVSIAYDSPLWVPESECRVRYPSEVEDDALIGGVPLQSKASSWLRGWNFVTDLHRILEHALTRIRRQDHLPDDRYPVSRVFASEEVPNSQVMDNALRLYYQLPAPLRNFSAPATGELAQDLLGFQAASVQMTLQSLRVTLFSATTSHDLYQKCYVTEQVLTALHSIAPQHLLALGAPLAHHLSAIGRILEAATQGLLCEQAYQRVRSLLISLADLLQALGHGIPLVAGADRELRARIHMIDEYIEAQRQLISSVDMGDTRLTSIDAMDGGFGSEGTPVNVGLTAPLEEFQLPDELVGDEAWPWPFAAT